MGCAASNSQSLRSTPTCAVNIADKEAIDTRPSTPQKLRENSDSCPFCEFDDEFREVRRPRTKTVETLQSSGDSANTSQRNTIDVPYAGDDENFVVLCETVGDESVLKNFAEVQRLSQRSPTICTESIHFGTQPVLDRESEGGPYVLHIMEDFEEVSSRDEHPSSKCGNRSDFENIQTLSYILPRSNSDAESRGNYIPFSSTKQMSSDDLEIFHTDDDSRESVRTFVNKIEEETLERKILVTPLNIDIERQGSSGRGGRYNGVRSRSMSNGMEPLSPTKFAPRSIASVGKLSREKFIVGDFQDHGRVKTIVNKFQSPMSSSHNNLNGFFKPMRTRANSRAKVPPSPFTKGRSKDGATSDSGDGETEVDYSSSEGDSAGYLGPRSIIRSTSHDSPAQLSSGASICTVKNIVQNWGPVKESSQFVNRELISVKSKRNFSIDPSE